MAIPVYPSGVNNVEWSLLAVAAVAVIASLAPQGADGLDGNAVTGEAGGETPQGETALRPSMEARRAWILQATPAESRARMSNGMPEADQAVFTEAIAQDLRANGQDQGSEQCSLRIMEGTGVHWDCHAEDVLLKVGEKPISGRVSSGGLLSSQRVASWRGR
jgi:hypothetical protein